MVVKQGLSHNNIINKLSDRLRKAFDGLKKRGANNITKIETMQKYMDLLTDPELIKEWEELKNNIIDDNDSLQGITSLISTPVGTQFINAVGNLVSSITNNSKPEEKVYQDIQIPQSKNIIPNFKYSSIKDFNFIGNIKIDNIKNEETYIELSVNISFDLYELYNTLVLLVTSFHLVQEDGTIVHTFEDTPVIKDDIIKGNLINTFHNRFANIIKGYSLVDKINYYEIEDNSGSRLYFVDNSLDINKYMFLFGSSSIGPASIHPYKSLMIYFVNHVKRINIGAVMLTPNRQSYIIHCLAIPIDKNDLCSSARIEFYSYPEKYELYLNLSDVLIKS